jgi:Ca2+-binding RTX toxin-like protein
MANINGTAGPDNLQGTSTSDQIRVLAGDDFAFGADGDDRILGDVGNDQLSGENGDDRLFGGPGSDRLSGDSGVDRLFGEDGDDQLLGGVDNDALYGGAGSDQLIINPAEGQDTIWDFTQGQDKVNLAGFADADFVAIQPLLTVVGNNTELDLSSLQGLPDNTQVVTLANATGLGTNDFIFSSGAITAFAIADQQPEPPPVSDDMLIA